MRQLEPVHETIRTVVQRQSQDGHVVGVHHAVAKAHGLPVGHQQRRAPRHFAQQVGDGRVRVRRLARPRLAAFGIVAVDHVIGQRRQAVQIASRRPVLERAKAHEAGRHARDDGGGFHGLAVHRIVRRHQAQRARRRDAQAMHGLAGQVFAHRRAQHRAAVAHARIRRHAGALELQPQLPAGPCTSPSRCARPSPNWPAQMPNWWPL